MPTSKLEKVDTNIKVRKRTCSAINRKKLELNASRRRKLSQSDIIEMLIVFHDMYYRGEPKRLGADVQEDAR